MGIKSKLVKFKKNLFVLYVWNEHRRIKGNRQIKKISDEKFIFDEYKKSTGHELNLSNPQRYTEKLQWLKLFYRDKDIELTTDKYTVREYLVQKGYGYILNDLIGAYDSVDKIDFSDLPDKFVIKLSHGSGWNIICKDKSKLNWGMYKRIIKSWMKQNLYIYGREWNYNNLTPKIVVEKYIQNSDGQLTDYKFMCFNGEPTYVMVIRDRYGKTKKAYYDMDWNRFNHNLHLNIDEEKCPQNFEEMKKIAKDLSSRFPFVRLDFYDADGRIYFGEFTYFGGSGFFKCDPDENDFIWGEKLQLPEPNHNLDLYKKIKGIK